MSVVGIKLKECCFSALCAKIIRKYNDISISEIKKLITNNDYLLSCDYIDDDGIIKILQLHKELETKNIASVLYEDGSVTSVDFLTNLLNSYQLTAQRVEEDMNNEALAEDF